MAADAGGLVAIAQRWSREEQLPAGLAPGVTAGGAGDLMHLLALYLAWLAVPGVVSAPEATAVGLPARRRPVAQWDLRRLGVHAAISVRALLCLPERYRSTRWASCEGLRLACLRRRRPLALATFVRSRESA